MSPRSGSQPSLWLVPSPADQSGPVEVWFPPLSDDAELLASLRACKPGSGAALHDRARPTVDQTIRRLLGHGDVDHEDIAQLAMIELVGTIGRYRGDCSLDSWTSTLTARVVYKHLRRRKTERRIFGSLDAELVAGLRSGGSTLRNAIVRNVMRRVLAHLEAIDETKASTFVLHDVCGYDLREIAEITGVSITAAQTRLVRGRREVHERIAADPELANLLESFGGDS
ncbi:MAG TPA: sigma-70 family RNA polymerase sigma factor [Polyangiaceae bacterium]|nr:sigma-70 family RNA polymerase sigma factor [Polyangiaceae bacterium]